MTSTVTDDLWAHENLHAWCVVPFDARRRGPEERAQMLRDLGIGRFAYDWRPDNIPTFDAEIKALKRHGIALLAWWWGGMEPDDPQSKATLEVFRRNDVRPQLWVMQSISAKEWAQFLPDGFSIPQTHEELEALPEAEKALFYEAFARAMNQGMPKTPAEQEQKVQREAERIGALAEMASPYGCQVALYNHNGWLGIMENELALIKRLEKRGVTNVGIAYNFSHCRDELHDDTTYFTDLWPKLKPYALAVNIAGTHMEDATTLYPSQGDRELEMMRTIADSGWTGPVGLLAETGGDAKVALRNARTGLDWLAAELHEPGSGGPRPQFSSAEEDPQFPSA